MSGELISGYKGEILEITINRPDAGNGMSDPMIVELGDIIEREQRNARLIVLRGAGNDFCVGRASMGAPRPVGMDAFGSREMSDIVFRAYGLLRQSHAPVLAVVQGKALGFGFALAAAADITIASDKAAFQIPEFGHNIMPTMVMSSMIDRVPMKALMYHVWTTETISAHKAMEIGTVSKVVPHAELEKEVEKFTAGLLAAPRPAVHAVKEYGVNAQAIDMNKAVHYARNIHALINTAAAMKRH
jgi:enoyl-CoA hydratase